jgi:uncharacterized protein YkwD
MHPEQPPLRPLTSFRASTIGVVAALCAGADTPAPLLDRAEMRAAVACLLGAERAERLRGPLQADPRLERGAQRHARDMVERRFFSHVSPGGSSLLDRLRRTGYVGGSAVVVGEVLARGRGTGSTPAAFHDAWMASPGHRAVLLDGRFEHVGVGVAPARTGRDRRGVTVAVTFGRRGR